MLRIKSLSQKFSIRGLISLCLLYLLYLRQWDPIQIVYGDEDFVTMLMGNFSATNKLRNDVNLRHTRNLVNVYNSFFSSCSNSKSS